MKEENKKRIEKEDCNKMTSASNNKSLAEICGINVNKLTVNECDKLVNDITDFITVIEAKPYEGDEEEPERIIYNNPNKKENDKVSIGSFDDGELVDAVYLMEKKYVKDFNKAIQYAHENEEDKEYMSFMELVEEYLDMNQIPYELIGISNYYCVGDEDIF